jgi:hypothetical protein
LSIFQKILIIFSHKFFYISTKYLVKLSKIMVFTQILESIIGKRGNPSRIPSFCVIIGNFYKSLQ